MSAEPAPDRSRSRTHWIIWLFAVFGLLGAAALIFIAVTILGIEGARQPAKVAGGTPEESFTLRDARRLDGTNLIQIDIAASTGLSGSSAYSGRGDDLRNILLLDKASGTTRRLLPDNSRRIAQTRFLPAEADFISSADDDPISTAADGAAPTGQAPAPPPAYYVLMVEQGGRSERLDVLVGTLASGRQAYVMQGLDGVDTIWMQSPTRIGFIVRERLNLYYRIVDIPALRVVQSRRIAI